MSLRSERRVFREIGKAVRPKGPEARRFQERQGGWKRRRRGARGGAVARERDPPVRDRRAFGAACQERVKRVNDCLRIRANGRAGARFFPCLMFHVSRQSLEMNDMRRETWDEGKRWGRRRDAVTTSGGTPSLLAPPTARRRRYIRRDAVATCAADGETPSLHPTAGRRRYIRRDAVVTAAGGPNPERSAFRRPSGRTCGP